MKNGQINLKYLLITLILVDMALTMVGMYAGYEEGHPVTRYMFENFGYFGIVITFGLLAIGYAYCSNCLIIENNKKALKYWAIITKIGVAIRLFVVSIWVLILL